MRDELAEKLINVLGEIRDELKAINDELREIDSSICNGIDVNVIIDQDIVEIRKGEDRTIREEDIIHLKTECKTVCCKCGKELTEEEIEYNKKNALSGYCTKHRKE